MKKQLFQAYIALATVSIFWGTTYLAMRVGVQYANGFAMAGLRQAAAGLLLAGFFIARGHKLNDVPPGLHHDEVIIGQVARDILRGNFAIYFTAGYGHEPLYHYLVAGFFAALGASAFALRLTSAFIAVLGPAVAYRLTRRLFSPAVAVGMLAWMSLSLWPVFFARVGLRGITLPLLTTLTAYFLWKALHGVRITHYVLAGALLGLTLYTYQASRVFPVIFAVTGKNQGTIS